MRYKTPCPFCGKYFTSNRLSHHTKHRHHEEWEKWRTFHLEWDSDTTFIEYLKLQLGDFIKCPECRFHARNNKGLALHTLHKHSVTYCAYLEHKKQVGKGRWKYNFMNYLKETMINSP